MCKKSRTSFGSSAFFYQANGSKPQNAFCQPTVSIQSRCICGPLRSW